MKIQVLLPTLFMTSLSAAQQVMENGNTKNLLLERSPSNLKGFTWMNPPKSFDISNGILTVEAPKGSDFFNNPEDGNKTGTAPFLFTEIKGDFVVKARVQPDFSGQWNAVALMVHIDENYWIKFAFENSDATGPSIVTVVTKDLSDDANGVVLVNRGTIWLKLIRKRDNYAMLWSEDDSDYKMARLTSLPKSTSVKIGLEAQCPVGLNAKHLISFFGIEQKTVKAMRKGF
ncbi:MAG: DUF1349 domain-containing protein [Bacteroidota bacterium]